MTSTSLALSLLLVSVQKLAVPQDDRKNTASTNTREHEMVVLNIYLWCVIFYLGKAVGEAAIGEAADRSQMGESVGIFGKSTYRLHRHRLDTKRVLLNPH